MLRRIWQFNAVLLTAALLCGAWDYGLLPSVFALVVLCGVVGLILNRNF